MDISERPDGVFSAGRHEHKFGKPPLQDCTVRELVEARLLPFYQYQLLAERYHSDRLPQRLQCMMRLVVAVNDQRLVAGLILRLLDEDDRIFERRRNDFGRMC